MQHDLYRADSRYRDDDVDPEKLDKLLSGLDAINKRLDAMEEEEDRRDARRRDAGDSCEYSLEDDRRHDRRRRRHDWDDEDYADSRRRHDSINTYDLQAQVNALRHALPKSPDAADYALTVAHQARLDDAYRIICGRPAPPALQGEGPVTYHARLLADIAHRNRTWTPRSIDGLRNDSRSLTACEPAAIAEARRAALADVPEGELLAVPRNLPSGHSATEYYGRPSAWMSQFAGNRRQAIFNRPRFVDNQVVGIERVSL